MDKEKQIKKVGQYLTDIFNERKGKVSMRDFAEALYNSGYLNPYEWISVEDRLPEVESTGKGWGDHKVQKSVRVLCVCKQKSGKVLVKEGYYELWDYTTEPYWRIPGSIDSVTHWMPLPSPPTEKEN